MPTLYLVRHAIAADRGDAWPDDDLRPLTHEGMARMRAGVAGLRAMGVTFDSVLASPLVRARQTADLLVEDLRPKLAVIESPALAPGRAPAEIARALSEAGGRASVALVGHEPDLGELAAWLIGAQTPLVFKKGGVCCIECANPVHAGGGTLQWMALPKMLRALS
jgi:phosphohistidine phosphatase